jgi:DNA mismatch repair ATPase MutS
MGWGMNGDTHMRVVLPPTTEDWADDLIRSIDVVESVERRDDGVHVKALVGGNCNVVTNAEDLLSELEDALREGEIDPFEIAVVARKERV